MFDSFYPYNPGTWCNGNTTVFGAVIAGSNPTVPTIWLYGVTVSTSVSEAESPGSNPGGATIYLI